ASGSREHSGGAAACRSGKPNPCWSCGTGPLSRTVRRTQRNRFAQSGFSLPGLGYPGGRRGRPRDVAAPLPSTSGQLLLLALLALLVLLALLRHAYHPASRFGRVNDMLTMTSTYH